MKHAKSTALILISFLGVTALANRSFQRYLNSESSYTQPQDPQLMSVEELKTKLEQGKVTVIDVRDTKSYVATSERIKGSIYVKVRRLAYRLSFAPLKDVPRDSEVVTYCSCPHDEASFSAARILLNAGFRRVYVLKGGWESWRKAKGQIEPKFHA